MQEYKNKITKNPKQLIKVIITLRPNVEEDNPRLDDQEMEEKDKTKSSIEKPS